ncbi:MAG: ATP-binding protein [Bacteroidota bacterium]
MKKSKNFKAIKQLLLSVSLVVCVATVSFFALNSINYKVVALLLLVTVSIAAMFLDIIPVLICAILSALIWNFFFIPPVFTFHIDNTEDILMFLMYFLIALINGVLTYKIRQVEKHAREKEEKEKVIKLYNTLLNSLSHELRTPIATIMGSVELLRNQDFSKEDSFKISEENRKILLQEIDLASFRLNKQVQNLLNMSRLESGMLKPKLDWIDVEELIRSVIYQFSDIKSHKIEYYESIDDIPLYKTDGGILEQVLYNLIQNAVLYTPEKSEIVIQIHTDTEELEIEIADNGKGFPEETIPHVFDKFYRLPNTKTSGVGLGLSIVKGYVEALNGKIELENKISGGARFTISLLTEKSYINSLNHE